MKSLSFIIVIFIAFSEPTFGWRKFWKGRRFDGNVGPPTDYRSSFCSERDENLWFTQKLDHFEPTNDQIWKQRYFVNEEFFEQNGPVFILIGGESKASAGWMTQGAWIHYAKQFGALCFQLEHRFYGKSQPTDDLSTKNLRYLSSEQALADLAYFITSMKQKYNLTDDNRWIAFGGSYAGALAAWFREKYAHLVHGAISTSGPILAKIDFYEYFQIVVDSLKTYKKADCVTPIQTAIQQVDILLEHISGNKILNEKLKLCDPIEESVDNSLDIANLYDGLASNFADVVQNNKHSRDDNSISIDTVCDLMTDETVGYPVDRLAAVNSLLMEKNENSCLGFKYDKMVKEMKDASWDFEGVNGDRQWTYQTCTEFGFYQTSNKNTSVFGDKLPAEFFVRQCADIFGGELMKNEVINGVDRTNIIYGALKPATTNVLYVHGSIDPWHALGLTSTDENQPQPTIYIQGTAHCANMYEPSDEDFPQLKRARKAIAQFINNLLE